MRAPSARMLWTATWVAMLVLLAASAWAEAEPPSVGAQSWLVPLVGALVATTAFAMQGSAPSRALLAVTAAAWLAGSLSPWLLVAHQGVLLLVLLVLPTGRLDGWTRLVALPAIPVGLGVLAQTRRRSGLADGNRAPPPASRATLRDWCASERRIRIGASDATIWRSCKSKELEVLLILVEAVVDDLCSGETHDVVVLATAGGVHFQTGVLVAVADHPAAVRRHR